MSTGRGRRRARRPLGAALGCGGRAAVPDRPVDTELGGPGRPRGGQDCLRYRLVCFVLFLFLTRTRKSLPVLRREKGSRCFISPEKLLQRHTGAQTNQSDSGNGPSPANLGAPGGRKAPVAWRAGRSCGGDADGLLPRRSAASAPLQRGQSGRTAPHPPPAAGTCRRLTPAPGAGRDLHYGRRTFAVRGRPQTGPS